MKHGAIDKNSIAQIIYKSAVRKTWKNIVTGSQNGANKVSKTIQIEPKRCQSEPWDVPQKHLGKRIETVRNKLINLVAFLISNRWKTNPTNHLNKCLRQIMILILKGCQHGAEFDAKAHQTSMPKQVTKQIANISEKWCFEYDSN